MNRWLRTDEYEETKTSLEMVCEQLPKVVDELHKWKWVIISLHNAMQGCMVLALRGGDSLDVMNKEDKEKWLAYRLKSAPFPIVSLDKFLSLYKKIKKVKFMKRYTQSQRFKPKGTQTDSVKMLNRLRNQFIHYFPMNLSLEVSGLLAMVQDCIDIIDFLAFECGNILWHDESVETNVRSIIKAIRLHLNTVRAGYGE